MRLLLDRPASGSRYFQSQRQNPPRPSARPTATFVRAARDAARVAAW
jgi:hypothetical protein